MKKTLYRTKFGKIFVSSDYTPEFWEHIGAISVNKIKEKTGCSRVLMPTSKRRNVNGTDLIAFNDGGSEDITEIWEAWRWFEKNHRSPVVLPLNLLSNYKNMKEFKYRLTKLSNRVWVERKSRYNKIGEHGENNRFLLLYKL